MALLAFVQLIQAFVPPLAVSCSLPTAQAFVTLDPSKASPQPRVEPDPLGNSPSLSARSATPSVFSDASLEVPDSTSSASPVQHAPAGADPTAATISTVTDAEPPPSSAGAPSTAVRTLPPPSPGGTLDELSPAGDLDFDDGPFAVDDEDDFDEKPRGMGALVPGSGEGRRRMERTISDTGYSCRGVSPSSQADEDAAAAGVSAVAYVPGSTTASATATATASAPASTSGLPSASGSLSAPKSGGGNSHHSAISPAYGPGLTRGAAAAGGAGGGDGDGFGRRSSPAVTGVPFAASANGWRPVVSSQGGAGVGPLDRAEGSVGATARMTNDSSSTGRVGGHVPSPVPAGVVPGAGRLASEGRCSETGAGGDGRSLLGEVDGMSRKCAAFRTLDTVEKTVRQRLPCRSVWEEKVLEGYGIKGVDAVSGAV